MNNLDMNNLLKMLSTMNKKDLEKGIKKANEILNSKDKNEILNQIKNKST